MKSVLSHLWAVVLLAFAVLAAILPIGVMAEACSRVWAFTQGWRMPVTGFAAELRKVFGADTHVLGVNTLTRMIPDLYESLDIISRELVGFIPAVTLDASVARAAVNQDIVIPMAPASAAADITPGVTAPNDGDQTIGNVTVRITKTRGVPFRWNGEEQRGVNHGPGYRKIRNDQMLQAMRTLVNEIETDVGGYARHGSRAFGTAGTTPFAANLADANNALKIMQDNGAPLTDLQMVIDTAAGLNLRNLATLQQVNTSGTDSLLRQGILLPLSKFDIRESAGVAGPVTKGTGAGYTTTAAGFAKGTTVIPLITGAGTVLEGDVVTFAGDTNKYIVEVGIAAPGSITLAAPGLRVAIPAAATAMTIGNNFTANCFFHRSAIVVATRAPALPEEGDMADDRTIITDPRSGLAFEVAVYKQYRQVRYEISAAWGGKNIKKAHSGVLLG